MLPIMQEHRNGEYFQEELQKAVELLKPLKHKTDSFPLLYASDCFMHDATTCAVYL